MAAVVVAIKNKRYDAEEAEDSRFENKEMLTAFPLEHERKADLVMRKFMIDGFVFQVPCSFYRVGCYTMSF